jgi:hypothetical protein
MALSAYWRPGYSVLATTRVEVDGWSAGAPACIDNDGTEWSLAPLEGWHDSPPPRLSLEPRPSEHGAFDGDAYNDPRVITVSGKAKALTLPLAKKARDIASSVLGDPSLGLSTFKVYTEGLDSYQAAVRRSGQTKTAPIGGSAGFAFSMLFTAPDPRRYSTTLLQPSTGLALPGTGGLVFPLTFPLTFGSGASGGELSIVNDGTTAVWPYWVITGPITGASITNVGTGETLTFSTAFSIPSGGVTLTIDTDSKAVTMQGVNYRSALTTAQWFQLQPGTTTVRFSGTAVPDPAALLTCQYRKAIT